MEEDEAVVETGMSMRTLALTATGDFFLLIGMLFIFLGVASFVTDFIGIKGAGEFLVGVVLCAGALALLVRSRAFRPRAGPPQAPQPQEELKSADYR